MKKIFSFLAAALLSISAMAATTFTYSNSVDKQTKDGFSVTLDKGSGSSAPVVNTTNTPVVRLYAKNTITVEGTGITRLDLKFAMGRTDRDYTTASADCGSYVSGGVSTSDTDYKTDVWTGSANKVVITLGDKGQRSLHEIVINGEGGGTTGGGTTGGGTTGGDVTISGLVFADAYYWSDEEGYGYWDIDLYKALDADNNYVYPEVYLQMDAKSKTALAGTYDLYYGGYWKSEKDSVESDVDAMDYVGTLTISYNNGVYTFAGSFEGTDGKNYKFSCTPDVWAFDFDEFEEIELKENGGTTGGGTSQEGQAITVAEAIAIGGKLADKAETAETYTVVGYVAKIAKDYDAEKKDQCWFMCDDKAEVGSTTVRFDFEAYWCYIDAPVALGDYVSVTGKIKKYGSTIEIQNGQAKKISAPTGVKNAELELKAVKSLENGTLIIRRGEKTYNVLGAQF